MKILKKISLLFVLFFLYLFVLTRNYWPETIAVKSENIKISDIEVIPIGEIVGIKLYTSGVLVVGTSGIQGIDGKMHKPFEKTEIREGDSIIAINDEIVNNTDELISAIYQCGGEKIQITYKREEEQRKCEIMPVMDKNEKYKIGLWVRDSAAGVGTVTFYSETDQSFAALGHGITDIDTGDIIKTSSGEIDNVNIVSIVKGLSKEPGKIQGAIQSRSIIGNIYKNTEYGIYGIVKNPSNLQIQTSNKMNVALRQEIMIGEAYILSNVDGQFKKYKIEIEKTYLNNNYDNKSMLIKVTDEELLKKTGGIVQGMSGSPIIQNGKFCGAITHVFVNDPTRGYAVFADRMIQELVEN